MIDRKVVLKDLIEYTLNPFSNKDGIEVRQMRYYLILRDPVYFNEYTFSSFPSAALALSAAECLGKRFFRIDTVPHQATLEPLIIANTKANVKDYVKK
jgi:hypothetical protein